MDFVAFYDKVKQAQIYFFLLNHCAGSENILQSIN